MLAELKNSGFLNLATLGQMLLSAYLCVTALQTYTMFFSRSKIAAVSNNISFTRIASILFSLAYLLLTYFYVISDFSVSNVFENSHTAKPLLYKITGVWANHEGSMMLFLFIMNIFNLVFTFDKKPENFKFRDQILACQAMFGFMLGLYVYLTSNPFDLSPTMSGQFPIQGQGINPLLQDIGLAFHPPILYIGYVGLSLLFSAAATSLFHPEQSEPETYYKMVKLVKPYGLFSWGFLTLGVGIGSWWAYRELGWGGFWFWDPVENTSLLPWLAATALIHSVLVFEKRRNQQLWLIFFSLVSFISALMGFFLVRSGILSSVHSFASDPTRGMAMLVIVAFASIFGFGVFALRAKNIKPSEPYTVISREGEIAIANILALAMIATIMLAVFYPIILDFLNGKRISVGGPYFSLTFLPIAALTMLLAVFGPYTKWQSDKISNAFKELKIPLVVALALTAATSHFYGPFSFVDNGIFISAFYLAVSMLFRLQNKLKKSGKLSATFLSMFFAHFGIALVAISAALATALSIEQDFVVEQGQTLTLDNYSFTFDSSNMRTEQNFISGSVDFSVTKDGKNIGNLVPENRVYMPSLQKTTEAAIIYTLTKDIYMVLGQPEESFAGKSDKMQFAVKIFIKPFMNFIWLGVIMVFIGGLIGAFMRDKKKDKGK